MTIIASTETVSSPFLFAMDFFMSVNFQKK